MKKFLIALLFVFGLNSMAYGFATMTQMIKGGDEIRFSFNVKGVDVYLNGQMVAKNTGDWFSYKIQRDGESKTFTFKKSGYESKKIQLSTKFDSMFWGNILIGGALGSSTDSWFTSNTMEYTPNQHFVELEAI